MGQCIYCTKPSGFLRKSHKKCKKKHHLAKQKIVALVGKLDASIQNLRHLEARIKDLAADAYIDHKLMRKLIISGWERTVEHAFDDGVLSKEEEEALAKLKEHFSFSQKALDHNGAYTKIVKGAIIRNVLNGEIPNSISVKGHLPFNLQKTEPLIWLFQNVDYYEEKTRTQYVGGSQGVSIRVAKGLYYRTSSFKGQRIQTSETIQIDTGLMGVTNKHIYFSGSSKRFRIKFDKIVAFEPYTDGIGVQRDAATAKLQSFLTGDGWFSYNLITNLAQM